MKMNFKRAPLRAKKILAWFSSTAKRGNVTLMALIATSVISMILAGYLNLISTQYRNTLRSQNWNSVIATVEAGIEEALTHMNRNCVTNTINNQPYNLAADGWQQLSNSVYQKRGDM